MKSSYRMAAAIAVLLASAAQVLAQLPKDPEERAKVIAQVMQANSRQITLFDREGKELNAVGAKDLYQQPVFAPDSKSFKIVKMETSGTGVA